jgi:Mg/Co/Ni transporter MgtE
VCELVDLPPADPPVLAEAWARGRWLLGLLALQSLSSVVLDAYADLLRDHLVVTLFLTMLVGAGGNAGGQSAIHVIRGLATGSLRPSASDFGHTLAHQAGVGALLASGLAVGGYARVAASGGSPTDAAAISASLFAIVLTSVGVGTALPFGLARAGVDPANAGTSVQVVMDILGCAITCATCSVVLGQAAAALS